MDVCCLLSPRHEDEQNRWRPDRKTWQQRTVCRSTARQCVEMPGRAMRYRNVQNVRMFTNKHVRPFWGIRGRVAGKYAWGLTLCSFQYPSLVSESFLSMEYVLFSDRPQGRLQNSLSNCYELRYFVSR
jgi:hypothetical protein